MNRVCSRAGCNNVETTSGQFPKCARCKAAVYCSRECQKADFCSAGHTECALGVLSESATRGLWNANNCKQAVGLLLSNPSTRHTVPILEAIQTALSHTEDISNNFNNTLLDAGVLQALAAVLDGLGTPPATPSASAAQLTVFTTTAATLLELMRPFTLPLMLLSANDPAARLKWKDVMGSLMQQPAFRSWVGHAMTCYCSQPIPASGGLPLGAAAPFLVTLYEKVNHMCWDLKCSEPENADQMLDICVWTISSIAAQEQPMLHHVGLLGFLLTNTLVVTRGAIALHLAKRLRTPGSDTLRTLLWACRHLLSNTATATSPTKLWWCAALTSCTLGLARLCQWVASTEGFAGLKALATGGLAAVAVCLVDKVLFTEVPSAKLIEPVQTQVLMVMAHMATTSEGRACLARNGRLYKWLQRAAQLQLGVRVQVAGAAFSAVEDWALADARSRPYWCPLFPADRSKWEESPRPLVWGNHASQCNVDLADQLAAPQGQDLLVALLQGSQANQANKVLKASLVSTLCNVLPTASCLTPKADAALGADFRVMAKWRRPVAGLRQGATPTTSSAGVRQGATSMGQEQAAASCSKDATPGDRVQHGGGSAARGSAAQQSGTSAAARAQQAAGAPSTREAQQPKGAVAAHEGPCPSGQGEPVHRGMPAAQHAQTVAAGSSDGGEMQGGAASGRCAQAEGASRGRAGEAGLAKVEAAERERAPVGAHGESAGRESLQQACAACKRRCQRTHLCSGCMAVRYCGAECQRAHWKLHKAACRQARAAREQ